MVAQAPRKPAVVRNINIHAGQYKVLSSNGTDWYLVDLVAVTCSCKCGANGFRNVRAGVCRHVAAARVVARAFHDMRAARRQEVAPVAAPAPVHPAVAALLEAYGVAA